mmetsp:Transcript_13285/g.36603  ORF Transcript_13285/g.36603 Transcript_13285/m.36603 type:complete len:360 (+) Transcript_13285:40-1119(+)
MKLAPQKGRDKATSSTRRSAARRAHWPPSPCADEVRPPGLATEDVHKIILVQLPLHLREDLCLAPHAEVLLVAHSGVLLVIRRDQVLEGSADARHALELLRRGFHLAGLHQDKGLTGELIDEIGALNVCHLQELRQDLLEARRCWPLGGGLLLLLAGREGPPVHQPHGHICLEVRCGGDPLVAVRSPRPAYVADRGGGSRPGADARAWHRVLQSRDLRVKGRHGVGVNSRPRRSPLRCVPLRGHQPSDWAVPECGPCSPSDAASAKNGTNKQRRHPNAEVRRNLRWRASCCPSTPDKIIELNSIGGSRGYCRCCRRQRCDRELHRCRQHPLATGSGTAGVGCGRQEGGWTHNGADCGED